MGRNESLGIVHKMVWLGDQMEGKAGITSQSPTGSFKLGGATLPIPTIIEHIGSSRRAIWRDGDRENSVSLELEDAHIPIAKANVHYSGLNQEGKALSITVNSDTNYIYVASTHRNGLLSAGEKPLVSASALYTEDRAILCGPSVKLIGEDEMDLDSSTFELPNVKPRSPWLDKRGAHHMVTGMNGDDLVTSMMEVSRPRQGHLDIALVEDQARIEISKRGHQRLNPICRQRQKLDRFPIQATPHNISKLIGERLRKEIERLLK